MLLRRVAGATTTAGLLGCGGGMPLMHSAHALPGDGFTVGAGVSGTLLAGATADARARAQASTAADDRAEGAIAQALTAPGVAPWVGARTTVAPAVDVGIAYSGRSARLDGRYVVEFGALAVSAGLGGSAILVQPGAGDDGQPSDGGIPGFDGSALRGFGVDLPLLVGYRSDGNIVEAWAGAIAGVDRLSGPARLTASPGTSEPSLESDIEAERWRAGGIVGLMVGMYPIWVAIELQATYDRASGSVTSTDASSGSPAVDVSLGGVSFTPAGSVIARF